MLGQLAGSVVPLVRLPLTLVQGIETLIEQLAEVSTRALALLDDVEDIPDRIRGVLTTAEGLTAQVETTVKDANAIVRKAEAITTKVEGTIKDANVAVVKATESIQSVQPAVETLAAIDLDALLINAGTLLDGAMQLDPALVEHATNAIHSVPNLITTVEEQLLPALASLEGLVPVVAQLGVQVDHLDGTIGALVAGIPGATRLLKRGATPGKAQPSS